MRRHLWKYAALAATCAAAVAVPVAASQDAPPTRVAAVSTASEPVELARPDRPRGPGSGWPVVDRMVADADGDGTGDAVLLRQEPSEESWARVRLELQLSSDGANVFTIVRRQPVGFTLAGSRDAGRGRREVLLLHLPPARGDLERVAVFALVDGRLRRAP
jgi:hypothetical protein